MKEIITSLEKLFYQCSGEESLEHQMLPASGSERTLWRFTGKNTSAIGVHHPDKGESRAFLEFTKHFLDVGLKVPHLYANDEDHDIYLIEDLGDTTLFSIVEGLSGHEFSAGLIEFYKQALEELVKFQVQGGTGLDYKVCYPRQAFDRQSITWDLNYFKYDFLKLVTGFNEQHLEEDFQRLTDFLLAADSGYFMYRDFQSRNIMVRENELYFIDYQGGRKGPLQYDPVSLLFQVKADLPYQMREELLGHYLSSLEAVMKIDRKSFLHFYDGFILLRLLQVLGAYGFRGLIQKKSHFISSIPFAIKNIRWFLENKALPIQIPTLLACLEDISRPGKFDLPDNSAAKTLVVTIRSFAYKNGIPEDYGEHGGGFVFDCRALPNPGREATLKEFTGKDQIIRNYFESKEEVTDYLQHVFAVTDQSVDNYISRSFSGLAVNFGCTGGQHRSVYCAERLKDHLQNKYPGIIVNLSHRELNQ